LINAAPASDRFAPDESASGRPIDSKAFGTFTLWCSGLINHRWRFFLDEMKDPRNGFCRIENMKLTCNRASLASALQIVSGVVPTRTPKEVLKNVKLQIDTNSVVLIGTDQEVGIRYEVADVQTDSTGEVLLPTSRVISILRELSDDEVTLEATESALIVKGGSSEFNLSIEDPAEFPPVAAFEDESYYTIAANKLREMIRRTIFACDAESTRYALGGILLEMTPERATLAATDSRRLAVVSAACAVVGEVNVEDANPVIPAKAMQLIEKSLPDTEDDVLIAIHNNDVVVKCGGSTIYSRLVEGRFPPYAGVIPNEFKTTIDVVVGPFYSAVRQAQIVTNEESRGVDFDFQIGKLSLSSRAADVGESTVDLPIPFDAEQIVITFDPKYVADFLRILDGGNSIKIHLIDSESPAVFTTEDGYRYVVMPLARE
jgi:DNA polymerase-3 subunit beta